jgi:SAM-dependent methyltransferase
MSPTTEEIWKERLAPMDPWNRRLIMAAFAMFGIPPTFLDVGCGTGAMVELARRLGIDAVGVDLIANSPDIKHNLATPLMLGRTFALVLSLEVAEHIESLHAGVFLNNISQHMEDKAILIFSAAPPGQEGENHVHLKPASYWRTMLHNRRVYWDEGLTMKLALMWTLVPSPQMWLPSNVQIFIKREDDVG